MNKVKVVIEVLELMDYAPILDSDRLSVSFSSFGSDNFTDKEKNVVRVLLGDNLREFYYGCDTQYIYFKKYC